MSDPLLCVHQQVNQGENFARAQKEDNWLKYCWSQVRVIEGKEIQSQHPLPETFFLIWGVLLYYHQECRGDPCDLLIVPRSKVDTVLHLTHIHPLWGHLGPQRTR